MKVSALLRRGSAVQPALHEVLQSRSLLAAHTGAASALQQRLQAAQQQPGSSSVYCGFDPTAASLHVGHLLSLMGLAHALRLGHNAIVLLGGATARIGDPSGRKTERPMLAAEAIAANMASLSRTASRVLARAVADVPAAQQGRLLVLDNADWLGRMSAVELICGVGRYVRVPAMLSRDSVRSRLDSQEGISYAEFSYQIFQAYDFYHLHKHYGCLVQLGGSDQWGNIVAGTELIHKLANPDSPEADAGAAQRPDQVFGMTLPLLTTKSGEKLGKSAGNAVWLSADLTSPYELYQYLLQTEDEVAIQRLKQLTLLPLEDIDSIDQQHASQPHQRLPQKAMAAEVVRLVHGEEALQQALLGTELLFGDGQSSGALDPAQIAKALSTVPHTTLSRQSGVDQQFPSVVDLVVKTGLASSKSAARKLLTAGGVTLNDRRVTDERQVVSAADMIADEFTIVRVGRKHCVVVRWTD